MPALGLDGCRGPTASCDRAMHVCTLFSLPRLRGTGREEMMTASKESCGVRKGDRRQ